MSSDRYPPAGYYEQPHPHPHHHQAAAAAAAMSHYPPQPYRTGGYAGYHHPHAYPPGYGYGATATSSYMSNYYRYAPYASPHYSHQGMFTPAGQQLIPSSVLHYPPTRPHPYQPPGFDSAATPSLYSSSATPLPYGQSRGFSSYQPITSHYAPPGRSTTPAPNRTVLPPNYLEPLRNYTEQHQHQLMSRSAVTPKLEDSLPVAEQETAEAATGSPPPQRLTTSPPLISATGTDSGISNCSTRARSDSSQSTPVYSGEYPVNMSVESASCVSYHCPADGREYEEEQQQQQQQLPQQRLTAETGEKEAAATHDLPDDISATTAQSTSSPTPPVVAINDKPPTPTATATEINLTKPSQETVEATATKTESSATTPQDAVEQQQQQPSDINPINEHAAEAGQQQPPTNNWSPTPRRPRTPPVPQNSPVGYGQAAVAVPPVLAPLLQQQQQQQQQHTANSSKRHATAAKSRANSNNNNNRIIECDLIPSKKSKRKTSKKENGTTEHIETVENTVREQIRDIKPLPGFLQAFGSTEIGRFSERFLQASECLVERLAEEYAPSTGLNHQSTNNNNNYYSEPSNTPTQSYYPYEEHNNHLGGYQGHQMAARHRMRGYQNQMPNDYMAYERYAAYGAGRPRPRYGEIRCNGY